MSWPTQNDLRMMRNMPRETLLKLLFSYVKNLWRVDGLYFLGIEEEFGTEAATKVDANCWKIMGKIESRELKETLGIKNNDVAALLQALGHTTWALYQTEKESEASGNRGVFRVKRCRTQETRINRGLSEFPCKKVRFGYLQSFTEEFNSNIEVACTTCPPSPHPKDVMCEWVFTLRK
ncbi:MAG: hypothetical protein JSW72_03165 [Candidatus Bathyarchaeota archaeon]|nr:MAG: hypothetical protein JSW72_03165 [Candidatus Bathyarchaeota archaeon]